jgi:hypothetical protein
MESAHACYARLEKPDPRGGHAASDVQTEGLSAARAPQRLRSLRRSAASVNVSAYAIVDCALPWSVHR